MDEDFETIKGFDGYKINRKGNILCIERNKIINQTYDKDGYKICSIKGKGLKVHRLLAIQFIPNDDILKKEIDHIDRNRSNNDLGNLRWTDRSGNVRNRRRDGCISAYSGFRKNGEPYTNYRGSYTIPDKYGTMKTIRKCSCIDRKIVEDWLEEIKLQYP
jgi:hypothetical protein